MSVLLQLQFDLCCVVWGQTNFTNAEFMVQDAPNHKLPVIKSFKDYLTQYLQPAANRQPLTTIRDPEPHHFVIHPRLYRHSSQLLKQERNAAQSNFNHKVDNSHTYATAASSWSKRQNSRAFMMFCWTDHKDVIELQAMTQQ